MGSYVSTSKSWGKGREGGRGIPGPDSRLEDQERRGEDDDRGDFLEV